MYLNEYGHSVATQMLRQSGIARRRVEYGVIGVIAAYCKETCMWDPEKIHSNLTIGEDGATVTHNTEKNGR